MSRALASYARSGAWGVVAQAVRLIGAMLLSIMVVRSLDPSEYGMLSIARQVTLFVVVLSGIALERSALRFVPEIQKSSGGAGVRAFLLQTLLLRLLTWLVMMLLTVILSGWLEQVFHAEISRYCIIGVATALVFSAYNHVRAVATARFAMREVAMASLVGTLATLILTAIFLHMEQGISGILVAAGIGLALATLWMLPASIREEDGSIEEPVRSGEEPVWRSRRFVMFTLPFGGIAVLNYLVHSQTEVFFLGHFQGADQAGFFQLGFVFAQSLIDFLPLALWEISMAGFSLIAINEAARLPSAMKAYLTLLYLVITPIAFLGIAFSPSIITLFYTESMLPAALVSQCYFAIALVAALGAPIGMIIYARERVLDALKAYLIFAVVNVALDLLLIPWIGIRGAILGLAAAKILAVFLMAKIAWNEIAGLQVPWAFMGRALMAASPVLLWLLVDHRWKEPWQIALGGLSALILMVVFFRIFRVVGTEEAGLIARTRLPLQAPILRVLSGARVESIS